MIGKEKRLYGWCIVDKNGYPMIFNGQMPCFWLRKVAKDRAIQFGYGEVVRVFLKLNFKLEGNNGKV